MSLLAPAFSQTLLWVVLAVVVLVVVGGVVALTATLLFVGRSVSVSMRELVELRDVLAQQQVARQSPADADAGSPGAGGPAEGQQRTGGGEAKDGERGGAAEG